MQIVEKCISKNGWLLEKLFKCLLVKIQLKGKGVLSQSTMILQKSTAIFVVNMKFINQIYSFPLLLTFGHIMDSSFPQF